MEIEHTERFKELMQRTEPIEGYSCFHFTSEEIEFLGREDLVAFGEKYPNESQYYMDNFSKWD